MYGHMNGDKPVTIHAETDFSDKGQVNMKGRLI
jgi:hypothetical protein